MKTKEKFDERLARIHEYKKNVAVCRNIKKALYEARANITAKVETLSTNNRLACIKVYYTYLPMSQDACDDVTVHEEYCSCFDDEQCIMHSCPYHFRNAKYKEQKLLLQRAVSERRASFRKLFERIK